MKRAFLFSLFLVACGHESAPSRTAVAAAPTPAKAVDCGAPLPGFEKIAAAPLVVLGEVHGQAGPPAVAGRLACLEANASRGATLALEVPATEQAAIDAYLASDGGEAARKALLAGEHWARPFQDGRSSTAMLALLEQVRAWTRAGLPLHVVAIDDARATGQQDAEKQMAGRLVALVKARRGPVVMLVGNYHAHTVVGAPWDPKLELMAAIAKKDVPDLVSLDVRAEAGESWVCFTSNPDECGRKPMAGNGSGPAGTITIFPAADAAGFDGTYAVGPAVAADPAIGLSAGQEASALVSELRRANKPAMVDGIPAESSLGADARKEWCSRLMPLAEKRLPRSGDRWIAEGPCAAELVPDPSRRVVPDVKVVFDVGFFFRKPYAAASYDREAKTLYLALASLYQAWNEVGATRHEWLHAQHHAKAMKGDPLAVALMTFVQGPDYRPDAFDVDEVPVNLCDLVRDPADGAPSPQQLKMTERYATYLRKELDHLGTVKTWSKAQRAHVDSVRSETSWVGGRDAKKSLALLESVWKDTTTALAALKSTPPDIDAAKRVPLLANGICR